MVSRLYASLCNKSKAIDPPAKPAMDDECKLIFQKLVMKNKHSIRPTLQIRRNKWVNKKDKF